MRERRLTRRRVVAGTTAVVAALAGCSDEGGDDRTESESEGDGGGGGSSSGDGGTPTPEPRETSTGTPTPRAAYPDLGERTGSVAESLRWHATEYDEVMRTLRRLANRVVGVAADLRKASSVTANDLTRLEDATTTVAEFVRRNVQPYYPVEDAVTNGDNTLVQQTKLAAERGDTQALDDALERVGRFYGNYARRSFYETNFPNDVVYERLYGKMTRDGSTNVLFGLFYPEGDYVAVSHQDRTDDLNTDGLPQHAHTWDSGHVALTIVHPHGGAHATNSHDDEPTDRRVYAYDREAETMDILADAAPDRFRMDLYEPRHRDVFGPVRLSEANENEFYVEVGYTDDDFGTSMVGHFQTFPSVRDTQDAVEELLAADVFEQGTSRIVGDTDEARDWRRVFYTRNDVTLYAFMLEVGRVLVTLAPSETEWASRTDWPGPLADCWLGDTTPLDT